MPMQTERERDEVLGNPHKLEIAVGRSLVGCRSEAECSPVKKWWIVDFSMFEYRKADGCYMWSFL